MQRSLPARRPPTIRSGAPAPARPAPAKGPLPPEEQLKLAVKAQRDGCQESRARLVQANVGLVASIARRFRCRSLAFEDLVSEGMIGLIQAIDQFDVNRGVRFSSFAARLIERSIQRAVGEASGPVRLPPEARRLMARWRRAAHRFHMVNGMPPVPGDLAGELGVSLQAARALEQANCALSGRPTQADTASFEGGSCRAAVETPGNSQSPGADGSNSELIERVRSAVDLLDARMAVIVRMKFGLAGAPPLPLRSIAEQMGLSVERVRHMLARALGVLRRSAGSEEARAA